MDIVYTRIRDLRKKHKWTQKDLATRVGYTTSASITKIEKGEVDLPTSKVQGFAETFGVSPAYLMGWTDDPDVKLENAVPLPTTERDCSLPVLGGIKDGKPFFKDNRKEFFVMLGKLKVDEPDFCVEIEDESMEGYGIEKNDIVFVSTNANVQDGDIVCVEIGGTAFIRKVENNKTEKTVKFYSSDKTKPSVLYNDVDLSQVQIIGKALTIQKPLL